MNASVRFIVWGSIPVGALVGALIGGRYGALTALWVSVAGQLIAVLPVLLSPLRRMRSTAGAAPSRRFVVLTSTPSRRPEGLTR